MVRHALPDSVEDAPEVVLQTKCADVLVVDFLSANAQRLERLADRFRRSAAATQPTPGGDGSRSTSKELPPRNA